MKAILIHSEEEERLILAATLPPVFEQPCTALLLQSSTVLNDNMLALLKNCDVSSTDMNDLQWVVLFFANEQQAREAISRWLGAGWVDETTVISLWRQDAAATWVRAEADMLFSGH